MLIIVYLECVPIPEQVTITPNDFNDDVHYSKKYFADQLRPSWTTERKLLKFTAINACYFVCAHAQQHERRTLVKVLPDAFSFERNGDTGTNK